MGVATITDEELLDQITDIFGEFGSSISLYRNATLGWRAAEWQRAREKAKKVFLLLTTHDLV